NTVEYAFLEHCLREDLNVRAPRAMVVLRPIKLIITNYPADKTETFEVENNSEDETMGTRPVTFSRKLWIESDDFSADPPKKYNRLFAGNEVRLKSAYIVKCTGCKTDENGNITQVYAEYDPETRGGNTPDGRKVRGTIHWADAQTALDVEVRLYENLFTDPDPDAAEDFTAVINRDSLEILKNCKAERSLENAAPPQSFQFLRSGYFVADSKLSKPGAPVFNRAVALKDGFKPGL
ncbi:MAG: glutamine--tRNA ligase, partial [Oscillospiraceae bacterium]|nr:glutamine--tRNA ligase [Oscillospiraceae bacterium]